ncbi:methyl-CpG-binding domain-containing protein 9-like, partial [Rutidosis leptorrhynchoides]|uniref:methyl-CpG-binding domain-containing protein 9-like n=1 Tax=Rutidosis leptorrhynchoides TaxID=125765 RepID=UPI003A98DEF6
YDYSVVRVLQDGLPVQFEDFFITSIGKIDPRPAFHNTSQIWPIGYKSTWHDKLTGSIFTCNILDNGDCTPIFRVNRYSCTKKSTPNPSTVIYNTKSGPSDDIPIRLTTEESQHLPCNSFINGDLIGEFSVEGRSPSSAWQMVIETLLIACRQAFQDLKVFKFCCNHRVEGQNCYNNLYNVDSLDKFGCLNGHINSIPSLILTIEQLEITCTVLRRWLQVDRFGLDVEFVQELIEQLPEVSDCLGYKYLDERCQNLMTHTVKSGFFTVLKKSVVSNSVTESDKRIGPPGSAIVSNLPSGLIGDALQAYEFSLRFYNLLGQKAPLSRQKLEYELLNPWVDGFTSLNNGISKIAPDATKETEKNGSQSLLSNYQISVLKVVVEDVLANVVISDSSVAMESKSRKGRKKNMDAVAVSGKNNIEIGLFPVNEITWPEVARRYILVSLFMDANPDLEITKREFDEVFRCLNGDGGPLCGSYTGMAAIEADAVVLTEASKQILSSVKSKVVDFIIDKKDLNTNLSIETKRSNKQRPEWIKILEPIRKQPTNVGAKIRNQIKMSLEKRPPEWAKKMLLESISKEVYKGNAAGPTKKIIVKVLETVRNENPPTKTKAKESRVVRTISDVIIKRCRMVLRAAAAEDENKCLFGLMTESLLKPNGPDDVGNPLTVSRPLDFRTIDLRLDAGFYDHSHESFIEDVREVWQNLRMAYRNKPVYINLIDSIFKKLEDLYEQEVLGLIRKSVEYVNAASSASDETKNELNMMIADTLTSTLDVGAWEERVCKVCGLDENDDVLLLCDTCDAEYHTYCLDPPLLRIPRSSWYCPPCVQDITCDSPSSSQSQPLKKMKSQRDFTRKSLEAVADLAENMESNEYWELTITERAFLLRFLIDETLSSALIRNHITSDNCDSKRNFLGMDSAKRLYWVLGRPERLFVSGPHKEGDESSERSSSREFDSWNCYESDTEIKTLIEWLKDDDERENKLKETIIDWQRNKSNYQNNVQVDLKINNLRSPLHCTNARAELEKKFGSFDEGKIYRCDCLELVGSTRQHCFTCHSACGSDEVHRCDGFFPLKGAVDTIEMQSSLTNGLVESNTGSTYATNESPCEDDMSYCEGKNGKSTPSSSGLLVGRAFEIVSLLKITLLDIEAALPREAFRLSRAAADRLRCWREYLKSAQSIYEMVQATIFLEDMIKTERLKREWWYWSSPSAAAKISTVSSLALYVYALDSAVVYEKPPPPVDLIEPLIPEDFMLKDQIPKKSKLKSNSSSKRSNSMVNLNSSSSKSPNLEVPVVDPTVTRVPEDSKSNEEIPKKSKFKSNSSSKRSNSMINLNSSSSKSPNLEVPVVDPTVSEVPEGSKSNEEIPKKSKMKSNSSSKRSNSMVNLNASSSKMSSLEVPLVDPTVSVVPKDSKSMEEALEKSNMKKKRKSNSSIKRSNSKIDLELSNSDKWSDSEIPPGFGTNPIDLEDSKSMEEAFEKSNVKKKRKSNSSIKKSNSKIELKLSNSDKWLESEIPPGFGTNLVDLEDSKSTEKSNPKKKRKSSVSIKRLNSEIDLNSNNPIMAEMLNDLELANFPSQKSNPKKKRKSSSSKKRLNPEINPNSSSSTMAETLNDLELTNFPTSGKQIEEKET